MKYLDEFRNPLLVAKIVEKIATLTSGKWAIMEVCGGQTYGIVKYGLQKLLPSSLHLVHGPGCPVCVTPAAKIDLALDLARQKEIILSTFGDMMAVPGSKTSLRQVKAQGGDIRIVYSPLDAVTLAAENPHREVVFFAVGFETTAPAYALALRQAQNQNLTNFSLLHSLVLVPPAMEGILSDPQNRIDAFLAAGHVCTVKGYSEYEPLAKKYGVPIVVTGFEPLDLLRGIYSAVKQLEEGRCEVENQYARSVLPEGNLAAQKMVASVFEVTDQYWRGLGKLANSGLKLREAYSHFDTEKRFGALPPEPEEDSTCLSGLVLQGRISPHQCPAFGKECTPQKPLGAPMVSGEGACAAYYLHAGEGRKS